MPINKGISMTEHPLSIINVTKSIFYPYKGIQNKFQYNQTGLRSLKHEEIEASILKSNKTTKCFQGQTQG